LPYASVDTIYAQQFGGGRRNGFTEWYMETVMQ
jgi:hypothetical protein